VAAVAAEPLDVAEAPAPASANAAAAALISQPDQDAVTQPDELPADRRTGAAELGPDPEDQQDEASSEPLPAASHAAAGRSAHRAVLPEEDAEAAFPDSRSPELTAGWEKRGGQEKPEHSEALLE
jgi:hypothetical protein